ncbi:putative oxidoreductase [Corynebacterium resistens DSM 45100]|uniref:Oxidoreductase n=1 Tax=Corynebacterium resistens (strain DSM 45100 / JCM 12819 / GTC 2026 / SICGH 158) TaxID=662755 RepID=F8E2D7_CORRG|nr:NADPH-dependent FMN reductase [Corynebacterium resistens]AEI08583.1 putative oxidoreductase [Corynebacterium resistens DSM 45100]
MSPNYTISVLVGSLRRDSYALKIAKQAMTFFPQNWEVRIVDISKLPLYNFEYDDPNVTDVHEPREYQQFRHSIKQSHGILFVTPENNRTIPACLKNAVDIGSKPNSDVAWRNKPMGIISHSVGRMGGYSSQKNLRLALSYFDMPSVGQPEVFLGQSPTLISEDGTFANPDTRDFVADYISRLADLVIEVNA